MEGYSGFTSRVSFRFQDTHQTIIQTEQSDEVSSIGLHRPAVRLRARIQLPQRNQPANTDYHQFCRLLRWVISSTYTKMPCAKGPTYTSAHPLPMAYGRVFSLHIMNYGSYSAFPCLYDQLHDGNIKLLQKMQYAEEPLSLSCGRYAA